MLAGLFLEIDAGSLAWMIGLAIVHELTVLWDLSFTSPRRAIPAGERVTHTFLEAPPFLVAAAGIATHWEQFLALLGHGRQRPQFAIRLQPPTIPLTNVSMIFAALAVLALNRMPMNYAVVLRPKRLDRLDSTRQPISHLAIR